MSGSGPRCERCDSVIAIDDLRCPICNLTCPIAHGRDHDKTVVDILRCTGCGAAMSYEISKGGAACAFCGSVLELEHPADPLEEAQELLPFTVDRRQAEAAFQSWLGSLGWFRPGDLRSGARLETIRPLRWVGWVFDAKATVSWAVDTDFDARRAAWAPSAGQTDLDFDDVLLPATRGLTLEEALFLIPGYSLSSVDAVEEAVIDATLESFDVPRSTARKRLIRAVERLSRRRLIAEHLPGDRTRNLHTAIVLRGLEARRVAFPAWVLAYRYKQRLFRTVLSGQDAGLLEGEAPYSMARIAMAVAAAAAAAAGLIILATI